MEHKLNNNGCILEIGMCNHYYYYYHYQSLYRIIGK